MARSDLTLLMVTVSFWYAAVRTGVAVILTTTIEQLPIIGAQAHQPFALATNPAASRPGINEANLPRRLQAVQGSDILVVHLWEGGAFGLQNLPPQQTRIHLSQTLLVNESGIEYHGHIPEGIQADPDALLWNGTRQRMVVQCDNAMTAVRVAASMVTFVGFQFQSCSATSAAAVVSANNASNVVFRDCVFIGNSPGGGAEVDAGSELMLENVLIQQHDTTGAARLLGGPFVRGAAATVSGVLRISNSMVCNNTAARNVARSAAGISVLPGGRLEARYVMFQYNNGRIGSGVAMGQSNAFTASQALLVGCSFRHLRCFFGGCGFSIQSNSNATLLDTTFEDIVGDGDIWSDTQQGVGPMLIQVFSTVNCTRCLFSNGNNTHTWKPGGAVTVLISSSIMLQDSTFTNNEAAAAAAVSLQSSNGTFNNCTFINSTSRVGNAGAVSLDTSSMGTFTNCSFINSTARGGHGSALFVNNYSSAKANNCLFQSNNAALDGGAVKLIYFSWMEFDNCSFVNNTAAINGGVISSEFRSRLSVDNCRFVSNSAMGDGGVVHTYNSPNLTIISRCLFVQNRALRAGVVRAGGQGSEVNITDSVMIENHADTFAGAMWLDDFDVQLLTWSAAAQVHNCTFSKNSARYGGAMLIGDRSQLLMSFSSVQWNEASNYGGGIVVDQGGILEVVNSTFQGNTAVSQGGGIFLMGNTTARLENVTLKDNTAIGLSGGALSSAYASSQVHCVGCIISGNMAALHGGGVYTAGAMTIEDSSLYNNRALGNGGALYVAPSSQVAVTGSSFANNTSSHGGSFGSAGSADIYLSTFTNDTADYGGSVFVEGGRLAVRGSSVQRSTASMGGGGVMSSGGTTYLLGCSISECHSAQGGAVMAVAEIHMEDLLDVSNTTLTQSAVAESTTSTHCELRRNMADKGGAIYVGDGGAAFITMCVVAGNVAAIEGGGLASTAASLTHISNCTFDTNAAKAGSGGGLMTVGMLQLLDTVISNSTSGGSGGGMLVAGGATINSTAVVGNRATGSGAGLACHACSSLDAAAMLVEANFAGAQGGGLWLRPAGHATISAAVLRLNTARQGGGVYASSQSCEPLDRVSGTPCITFADGTRIEQNTADSSDNDGQVTLDQQQAAGGGMYIEGSSLVALQNVSLDSNMARLGGGLYADTSSCPSLDAAVTNLTEAAHCLQLTGLFFGGNTVTAAGSIGATAYVTQPAAVGVLCDPTAAQDKHGSLLSLLTSNDSLLSQHGQPCDSERVVGLNDPSSSTWASSAYALMVLPSKAVVAPRQPFKVQIRASDIYGKQLQLPTAVPVLLSVNITKYTLADNYDYTPSLLGASIVQSSLDQPVSFEGLQLLADPGTYTLEFFALQSTIDLTPASMEVVVRNCVAGESFGNQVCISCNTSNSFSLLPGSTSCQPCPIQALCSGGTLQPRAGYWQLHPRVAQLRGCLVEAACKYAARDETLFEFQQRAATKTFITDTEVEQYMQMQCNTHSGYTGRLCASCRDGFGRNGPLCTRCQRQHFAILALVAVCVGQALIVLVQFLLYEMGLAKTIAAASQMQSTAGTVSPHAPAQTCSETEHEAEDLDGTGDDMLMPYIPMNGDAARKHAAPTLPSRYPSPASTMAPEMEATALERTVVHIDAYAEPALTALAAAKSDTSWQTAEGPAFPPAITAAPMAARTAAATPATPTADYAESIPTAPFTSTMPTTPTKPTMRTMPTTSTVGARALHEQLIEEAVGVFKILLEFVQLLGTVRWVKLHIPDQVLNFFQVADVTSAASGHVLYCSLSGGPEARAVGTAIFSVLSPLALCVVEGLVLLVFHSIRRSRRAALPGTSTLGWQAVPRQMFVACITTLLFFYPNVCRQLLVIFSFVQVGAPQLGPAGDSNTGISFAGQTFWRQVPDVRYYHGSHRALLLALGLPGFVVFALGFPLLLLVLLSMHRSAQHAQHRQQWYGMFINDYKEGRQFWQPVALLAQLLLVGCAVLLSPVGAVVQLISALAIIVAYQYLLSVLRPYKHAQLLGLARIMLLAVALTLLLLLYIESVHASQSKAALVVVTIVMNSAVVALLLNAMVGLLLKAWPSWRAQARAAKYSKGSAKVRQLR